MLRLLYTICFFLLCLCDQRCETPGTADMMFFWRDFVAVPTAAIVLTGLSSELLKKHRGKFLAAGGVLTAGGLLYYFLCGHLAPYPLTRGLETAGTCFYLWIFFYLAVRFLVEKEKPNWRWGFMLPAFAFAVLALASDSAYIWPAAYFAMFLSLAGVSLDARKKECLLQGALDGVFFAFIAFQAFCCVFRPYDLVRYVGIYSNSNQNARFYLVVQAAVLGRLILLCRRSDKSRKWQLGHSIIYTLGLGAVLSLQIYTIGRMAWMVACAEVVIALLAWNKLLGKKRFFVHGIAMVLAVALMIPVTYGLIRYVPPIFHHPVWMSGEYAPGRVHSFDPWDSPKYVEPDELLENISGRLQSLLHGKTAVHSPFAMVAYAAEPGDSADNPLMEGTQETLSGFAIRRGIYGYYFKQLNWTGHVYEDESFYLTNEFWVIHTHDILLQCGMDFGIPALLLFLYLIGYSFVILIRKWFKEQSGAAIFTILMFCVPFVFGLIEYAWGVGSLPFTIILFGWSLLVARVDGGKN